MKLRETKKLRDVLREVKALTEGIPNAKELAAMQKQIDGIRDGLAAIFDVTTNVPLPDAWAELRGQVDKVGACLAAVVDIMHEIPSLDDLEALRDQKGGNTATDVNRGGDRLFGATVGGGTGPKPA